MVCAGVVDESIKRPTTDVRINARKNTVLHASESATDAKAREMRRGTGKRSGNPSGKRAPIYVQRRVTGPKRLVTEFNYSPGLGVGYYATLLPAANIEW